MTNTKKKQTGLGAATYFEDVPDLATPEQDGDNGIASPTPPPSNKAALKVEKKKIRRTYAISEDAHLALDIMKLESRKQGENATLGELMEEAIELLAQKRGVELQTS